MKKKIPDDVTVLQPPPETLSRLLPISFQIRAKISRIISSEPTYKYPTPSSSFPLSIHSKSRRRAADFARRSSVNRRHEFFFFQRGELLPGVEPLLFLLPLPLRIIDIPSPLLSAAKSWRWCSNRRSPRRRTSSPRTRAARGRRGLLRHHSVAPNVFGIFSCPGGHRSVVFIQVRAARRRLQPLRPPAPPSSGHSEVSPSFAIQRLRIDLADPNRYVFRSFGSGSNDPDLMEPSRAKAQTQPSRAEPSPANHCTPRGLPIFLI